MRDIECPYCNKDLEINHDDGYGYREGEVYQQECEYCQKNFTYRTSVVLYYSAEKADCLNGGEHDYKPTLTYPKEYTKMRCSMCDEERKLTSEEYDRFILNNVREEDSLASDKENTK